ncbi:MAG: PHP domain-containing protein [Candidatus Diapherotrites archaeon]|nr:PHP domain-containing protein [Candidatus Diapherotrites archaeon]
MMKLDMHFHSNYSPDSITLPKTALKIAKKNGLTLAVTEHNITSSWPVFKKLSKELGVEVIFGEEIKVMEEGKCVGEIVGLFLKEFVKPAPAAEVFEAVHAQAGLAMVVHPFDIFRHDFRNLEQSAKKIDLLEAFNSRTVLDSHNKKAFEFAQKNKLPMTANSDSHSPNEIGMAYSQVEANTLEEARRELIKGHAKLVTRKSPIAVHLTTQLAKMNLIKDE